MTTFICTSNAGKLREFRHALGTQEEVLGIHDILGYLASHELAQPDCPKYHEPLEDCDYFAGNAVQKLISAIEFLEQIVEFKPSIVSWPLFPDQILVDDSGLCVPKLNFQPGVHSATFSGVPRDDSRNREKLRGAVRNLGVGALAFGNERRTPAFFICLLLSMKVDRSKLMNSQAGSFARSVADLLHQKCWPNRNQELELFDKKLQSHKLSFSESGAPGLGNVLIQAFYGMCHGFVSDTEQNLLPDEGHGYDSMFYHEASPQLSFASVSVQAKNEWSHRGRAVAELLSRCRETRFLR